MKLSNYVFNESEQKIRKQWLWLTLLYGFLPLFILCSNYLLACMNLDPFSWMDGSDETFANDESVISLIFLLVFFLLGLLRSYTIWYCSYKKCGTTLLTCCLVLTIIQWPLSFGDLYQNFTAFNFFLEAIDSGIILWWIWLSLKVRKINKKVQAQSAVPSPEILTV